MTLKEYVEKKKIDKNSFMYRFVVLTYSREESFKKEISFDDKRYQNSEIIDILYSDRDGYYIELKGEII